MGMRIGLLMLACGLAPGRPLAAGDPREVWEQAVNAKGGRERLRSRPFAGGLHEARRSEFGRTSHQLALRLPRPLF